MARVGIAVVVALVALESTPVFAFPSSRLVYVRQEGAEACPVESSVRGAVTARLGYDPFLPAADKTIVAEIAGDGGELRGRLELVDEHGLAQGSREFRTPPTQCEELVATMALAISIAVDPTSEHAQPADNAQVSIPPPARESQAPIIAAEPAVPESLASPPIVASSASTAVRVGLSLTTSLGTSPELAPGAGVSVGLRWRNLSMSIEGRGDWSTSQSVSTGGSVSTSLWVGTFLPCVHVGSWLVCGEGAVGSLRATASGLVVSQADDAFYAAAGARVAIELPLGGPFSLRPQMDVLVNLARPELRVDNARVWQVAPFSAVGGVALLVSFP